MKSNILVYHAGFWKSKLLPSFQKDTGNVSQNLNILENVNIKSVTTCKLLRNMPRKWYVFNKCQLLLLFLLSSLLSLLFTLLVSKTYFLISRLPNKIYLNKTIHTRMLIAVLISNNPWKLPHYLSILHIF